MCTFRFKPHGRDRVVALVHHVEATYRVYNADRIVRLACTVGDGALEGPNSTVHFSKSEREIMGTPYNSAMSRSCDFHAEDLAGNESDKAHPLAKPSSPKNLWYSCC